jgi:hypothetical protein
MPLSNVGDGIYKRKVYRLLLQLKYSVLLRTIKSHCLMPQMQTDNMLDCTQPITFSRPINYIHTYLFCLKRFNFKVLP